MYTNNAVSSAYGEWWLGTLPLKSSILHVFFGGGIGGCWVKCAALQEVPQFHPFEIGHLGVAMHGPRCYCGGTGCLEQVVKLVGTEPDSNASQQPLVYALRSLAQLLELDLIVLGGPLIEPMSVDSIAAIESAVNSVQVTKSRIAGNARAVGTAATVFQKDFIPCYASRLDEDPRQETARRSIVLDRH